MQNYLLFLLIYILIINIISFLLMGIDKFLARHNMYRISEKTLFLFSFMLGGIGSFLGMHIFRHKTKHKSFQIGIPITIIFNILIVLILFKYIK